MSESQVVDFSPTIARRSMTVDKTQTVEMRVLHPSDEVGIY